jgi:ATP-dependent DNA helicase RecQ
MSRNKIQVVLKLLKDAMLIAQDERLQYSATAKAASQKLLNHLAEAYLDKSEHDHEALERMVFYAQTGFCRWKVLLEYFGEQVEWAHCGSCDNCLRPPEQALSPLSARQLGQKAGAKKTGDMPLEPGLPVRVPRYGEGQVVSSVGDKVTIVFADSRQKTFLRTYVQPMHDIRSVAENHPAPHGD